MVFLLAATFFAAGYLAGVLSANHNRMKNRIGKAGLATPQRLPSTANEGN